MWYVVQVSTGSEQKTKELIDLTVDDKVLQECFVPRCQTMKRFRGEWVSCEAPLFPGYLIVATKDVGALERKLRAVPAFTKLLGNDTKFTSLADSDKVWIDEFTEKNHRVVGMSEGVIEGDEIIILSGPLVNHTGWIKKINRRKRLAYLEIQMFGRTIQTKVGLRIVRKSTM